MRTWSSYGPVDPSLNFAVPRRALVESCADGLVGDVDKGGHFFTLWAPRQTGKTWLMRRALEEIRARHGDRFRIGALSMQGVALDDDSPEEAFFEFVPDRFQIAFGAAAPKPKSWADWTGLFAKKGGYFDRPVVLGIDDFDSLPQRHIDRLLSLFRDMYLNRDAYSLHGLALVGSQAVLGVGSPGTIPFNIQRTLHVPNLTADEVTDLFSQYRAESGQKMDPAIDRAVYEVTSGQPELVSWFGDLLTEKHNPGPNEPITPGLFEDVYARACQAEWNNTILDLIQKARGPYQDRVVALFTDPNVPFALDKDWCSYLYLNGIIDQARAPDGPAKPVCRFSSPFVQRRLYAALTGDMFGDRGPILAIEPGDLLDDVFLEGGFRAAPLVGRYRGYLERLAARGIDPWKGQPRRADLHLTEAVGHFHLYAWLRDAIGRRCVISPEFPTGNGKVDLVIRWQTHVAVIEVKSFIDMYELGLGRGQAAAYAKKLGLTEAVLAVFVPLPQSDIPQGIAGVGEIDGVRVVVEAVGWV